MNERPVRRSSSSSSSSRVLASVPAPLPLVSIDESWLDTMGNVWTSIFGGGGSSEDARNDDEKMRPVGTQIVSLFTPPAWRQYTDIVSPVDGFISISGVAPTRNPHTMQHFQRVLRLHCSTSVGEHTVPIYRFYSHIHYQVIDINDTPDSDLYEYLHSSVKWLSDGVDRGEKCLVHCYMGRSRSATVVIAYLMYRHRLPLEAAFAFLKTRRPIVQPNAGFMKQLQLYENKLFRTVGK